MIFRSKSAAGAKSSQTTNPAAKRTDSAKVTPPIQNLERDPKTEAATAGNDEIVGDSDAAQLDCGSSSLVKSNQDTDDEEEDDEEEELHRIQAASVECNESSAENVEVSNPDLKSKTEEAPSSTDTETSSTVSSAVTTLSSRSTTACVGKPPLSRVGPRVGHDNRSSYYIMPQPNYIPRVKGKVSLSLLLFIVISV